MLVQRLLGTRLVVVRHWLVEDAPVARLFEIGGNADNQPVRIVVEVAADVVVAALGERLVLVIRAAGSELRGRQVDDALAGARRVHLDESQQVLIGVAEAQAAADARLVERRRARHVERRHALVGVPDIHHAVGVRIGSPHVENAEQSVPVSAQFVERRIRVGWIQVLRDDRLYRLLVDRLRAGRVELLIARILVIAQQEDDLLRLPGLQRELDLMRADGRPPVRDGVRRRAAFHRERLIPAAIRSEEGFALRVEPGGLKRAGEVGEVIAPLAVLGLVVDHAVFDFHLASAEVALKVGRVVLRVPQAEFDARERRERRSLVAVIGHRKLPDFEVLVERHEVARARRDAPVCRADRAVAHAVAATVVLRFVPRGLPGGRPELSGLIVPQIDITPAEIEGNIVVAVTRNAPQPGVAIERIAAGGV